jgi:hypothetical protein
MKFTDLNRSFVPLAKDQQPTTETARVWGGRFSGWLNWEDLRRRRRVILLAEAASGKTEEFRHQSDTLKAAGAAAFFLRIEELADQGTEAALDGDSVELLQKCLGGSGEAWFFLDSVDEARLNHKSFDTALRRFAKDLGEGLERAHVYVSCRVTDWRGADDRTTYTRYLPAWKKPITPPVEKPDDYSALLDPLFKEKHSSSGVATETADEHLDDLTVVQLAPLSTDQYRSLAATAGVTDVDPFVAAITKQGLEAFTERPGDLLDLADYWQSHGKFGSFSEMLDHSIARKLTERDPHRPDNEMISPDDARQGAERLAGALTLGKSFTLRAPGHDPDPSLAAGALDPAAILPDWTGARRNALLRRGIFAPATYGRIRFHHRSTQEYLTARWLDRLVRSNCPLSEVWQLLFAERYGVQTVVPSLRAIAAWLALWQPKILNEIIRREPLTLIGYGDPGSLSIAVREQLLLAYASKQAKAELSGERLEARELWMFADGQLASAVKKAWELNPREDFRFDMLRLIREGGIKDAAPLAKSVALDKTADDYHRIVAVQAADACHDTATLTAVATALLRNAEAASPKLAPAGALTLYPQFLSTANLLKVIERSQQPAKHSTDGFGYQLKDFYAKAPDSAARIALLRGVAELSLAKPFKDDFRRISARFTDIAKHLHDLTRNEALQLGDSDPPDHLIRLLMVVERAGRDGFTKEETPQLHQLVRRSPKLNRALFWADVAEQRANGKHGPVVAHWQVFLSGNATFWSFSEADLPWLNNDLASRTAIEDKQVALSAILEVLHRADRLRSEAGQLRTVIQAKPVLLEQLNAALSPPPESDLMRKHRLQSEAYDLKAKARREKDETSWIEFRDALLKNPSLISNPSNINSWKAGMYRLHYLSNWLHKRTGVDVPRAALQWRLLEEGFSREVAEAYRNGMKQVWRFVKPVRPIRKPGGVIATKVPTILAFAGVGIEAAEDPDWTRHLSVKEAILAARHGCRAEQHYPEWLDALVMSWPKAVLPILKEEIDHEYEATSPSLMIFLHRYAGVSTPIPQPVQQLLLAAFLKSDAKDASILRTTLNVIRNLELDSTQRTALYHKSKARFAAHSKAKRDDFALSYLALLLVIDADAALPVLRNWLSNAPKAVRQARAETTLSSLFDRYDPVISISLATASTKTLEALLHLAYSYIRPKDDAVHDGSYSPNLRDHAENARNTILSTLLERPGADAYRSMQRLADDPVFALRSHRFHELARGKAEKDTESPAWTAVEVLTFHHHATAPVKTGEDLLRVVMSVLDGIAQNLTHGDVTSRPLLERAKDEEEVQNWLVEQMNARARGRFHAFREPEVSGGNKPDVVAASTSIPPHQIAIEVKHGGKGWTARQLEYALRIQLAEDYLKTETRRHGVLVVTHHHDRRWLDVRDKKPLSFAELITWLSGIAQTLTENVVGPIEVKCVGINAWKDGGRSDEPKPAKVKKARATDRRVRKTPLKRPKATKYAKRR